MAQRRSMHRRNPSVDMPKYTPQGQAPMAEVQNHNPQPPAHLAHISDYESDNPYMSDYPSRPPPPARTIGELNLAVLQRHNNHVTSIISIAPYAVIYQFTPLPEPAWSKTGVEGSLFICQLTPGPYGEERYAAIVLNRRGLDNFEAPLVEGENAGVEITDEYVIVSFKQDQDQKIYGVFIFTEGPGTSTAHTRESNANIMKNLATMASTSRQKAESAAAEAHSSHVQQAEDALELRPRIDLQQLFGQQRAQDFNLDGPSEKAPPPPAVQHNQPDAIAALFRKAGIGLT